MRLTLLLVLIVAPCACDIDEEVKIDDNEEVLEEIVEDEKEESFEL